MGIFGMKAGKVLATLGLCMALFCVPAGANERQSLDELKNSFTSLQDEIKALHDKLKIKEDAKTWFKFNQTTKKLEIVKQRFSLAYFIDKGWKPFQAAAIIGNCVEESNLNPAAENEYPVLNGRYARYIGIAGWSKSASQLKEYARKKGKIGAIFNFN